MTETTEKKVLTYTLYVTGLYGRNRTVKTGSFMLGSVPMVGSVAAESFDFEGATSFELKKQKVKPGAKYKVVSNEETLKLRPDGSVLSRSFMVGGGVTILTGTLE